MTRPSRKDINPVRLHSKKFSPASVSERILDDGSIEMLVQGWASTSEKDYDGDIIQPEGIDLTRYNHNPIVKIGHKRDVEYNVGLAEVSVKNMDGINGIWIDARIVLNPEIPRHKEWIHGIRHGTINGWSIGFAKYVIGKDENGNRVISYCELHEVSLVDIPNNHLTVRKTLSIAANMKYQIKEIPLEQLTPGMMIRFVKTEHYSDWDGDVYAWSYCRNAEVVKIDGSKLYLLIYELSLDGFVPTEYLTVCDHDEITMIEITEEQLKAVLEEIETKDVETDTDAVVNDETTETETTDPVVEADTDTTDITSVDTEEVVEVIAVEETEKEIGNDEATKQLSTELEQTKALLDDTTKQLSDLTKELDEQKALNAEKDELLEKGLEAMNQLIKKNEEYEVIVHKATHNYKEIGKLYKDVEDKPEKNDPLKGRIKKA